MQNKEEKERQLIENILENNRPITNWGWDAMGVFDPNYCSEKYKSSDIDENSDDETYMEGVARDYFDGFGSVESILRFCGEEGFKVEKYRLIYGASSDQKDFPAVIEEYYDLDAALENVHDLDEDMFNKGATSLYLVLEIEEDSYIKRYTLAQKFWTKETHQWGMEEKYDFWYDSPDDEYEI